jgi:hypothetical protein
MQEVHNTNIITPKLTTFSVQSQSTRYFIADDDKGETMAVLTCRAICYLKNFIYSQRLVLYLYIFLLRSGVCTASNSAYSDYPELWILRYPDHRYHAVPSSGFEHTPLWLRVREAILKPCELARDSMILD